MSQPARRHDQWHNPSWDLPNLPQSSLEEQFEENIWNSDDDVTDAVVTIHAALPNTMEGAFAVFVAGWADALADQVRGEEA
jgi:hypothetical protein|tara:strand:+ start:173 stop:415 length:243 start_codon:yes stop_codon:yes gene_type:complete